MHKGKREEQRSTVAALSHGGQGSTSTLRSVDFRRPVCNHAAAAQFVCLQETGGWREGRERRCGPHRSRLGVTTVRSSLQIAGSKDGRRQRRSVPSFSHRSATPPTPSPASSPPTQRGDNSRRRNARNDQAAVESRCSRHDQTSGMQTKRKTKNNCPLKHLSTTWKHSSRHTRRNAVQWLPALTLGYAAT
ncbi:hypothetical protein TcCL_Unassigned03855 [Trypanosoma cruzi]|nr:hypothetical protein TcCL_Unassigned03855 [Trypanosoma cruzi]